MKIIIELSSNEAREMNNISFLLNDVRYNKSEMIMTETNSTNIYVNDDDSMRIESTVEEKFVLDVTQLIHDSIYRLSPIMIAISEGFKFLKKKWVKSIDDIERDKGKIYKCEFRDNSIMYFSPKESALKNRTHIIELSADISNHNMGILDIVKITDTSKNEDITVEVMQDMLLTLALKK